MQVYNLKINPKIFNFIDLAAKTERNIQTQDKIKQSRYFLIY